MDNASIGELKDQQVLLTGASGFTGSHLARKLVQVGARVRAIARSSSKLEELRDLPIEWVRGNVFEPSVIEKAAAGVGYVFHVAAAYREAKIADDVYAKVHVESTKLLAHECVKIPTFKRFVHVSTIGVHGHIDHPPANETYRFAPGDLYQNTKLEAELWLKDFSAREKFRYTVIRPAAIYGPGDTRLLKVFKMAAKPIFPILGHGQCLYHLIHVEDLCDAMMLAAVSPKSLNETFIVGNPTSIRLEDMARLIADLYGTKITIVRIPAGPFFLLGDVCEAVCKPFGIEPPIYRRRVAFFTKDRSFDTSKLRNVLGFTPRYSNEEGICQTARWYADHGWVKVKSSEQRLQQQANQGQR